MLSSAKAPRMYWLDNLRTFVVFLVIAIHAAVVYEKNGMGALWWIVSDPCASDVPGILFIILNIFVIATLFFISGYLAPLSLKHKSRRAFLTSKFKRLVLPWMIAVLTLIPLYKIIFLYSRNIPQENWTTYFHWNVMWSQNWLWFLPVLFLFNILYVGLSSLRLNLTQIRLTRAIGIGFLLSFLYGVCMDVFGLNGWTKTVLIDFQNERLFIYFMTFLLGAHCYHRQVFVSVWHHKKLDLILHCTGWIPLNLYLFLLIGALLYPGTTLVSDLMDTFLLRLNFTLSLAYLVYAMVVTFRRYLNTQGPISRTLSANSYGVYIIHVIVMGGMALALLNTAIPSLLKFMLLTVSTFGLSHLIIYAYRQCVKFAHSSFGMEASTMKTVTTAMILVALVLVLVLVPFSGCAKQDDSDEAKRPPSVDIHVAALQGHLDAIEQHIDVESDLNKKDAYGSSPLIVATTFGKTDVAKALIDAGADLTITNNEGSTALHAAAFFCRTEIVQALLDNGADKTTLNSAGRTALETVAGPFESAKGIYDSIGKGLKPLGLKLDYEYIKLTRPRIAAMLK